MGCSVDCIYNTEKDPINYFKIRNGCNIKLDITVKGLAVIFIASIYLYYCCVTQISYIDDYLVFSVRTATIAYAKEQRSTLTYFPYFLASLL